MTSTFIADTYICMKIAELGKRCGLRATDIDGSIYHVDEEHDPAGNGYYALDFGGWSSDPVIYDKSMQFRSLLGQGDSSKITVPNLSDLEDMVERALTLAPRARAIG